MTDETKRYFAKYSRKDRVRIWFSYNKWWLLLGIVLAVAAVWTVWQNVTRVLPDYQVAYVGQYTLPEETAAELEAALAAFGEDLNGDGRVAVQINEYLTAGDALGDGAMNQAAWETRLMADLVTGESCLFLLADPEGFQEKYEILEPGAVDPIALCAGLEGLTLARRGYAPENEPKDLEGREALWEKLTGGLAP